MLDELIQGSCCQATISLKVDIFLSIFGLLLHASKHFSKLETHTHAYTHPHIPTPTHPHFVFVVRVSPSLHPFLGSNWHSYTSVDQEFIEEKHKTPYYSIRFVPYMIVLWSILRRNFVSSSGKLGMRLFFVHEPYESLTTCQSRHQSINHYSISKRIVTQRGIRI